MVDIFLNKKNICKNARICESVFSQIKGLMFSTNIKHNDMALIFVFDKLKKETLHMFFVGYAIDVLFLDEKKDVVEIKENFRPFSVYWPGEKAKYIIEIGAGTINKHNIKTGDRIEF